MTNTIFETRLEAVELQLGVLRSDLLSGNPQAVHQASAALQQLAVDLFQLTEELGRSQMGNAGSVQRVRALAVALQPVREGLLRQSAYVDRALEVIMPAAQQTTYAGTDRYGAAARQSGAFKVLSA